MHHTTQVHIAKTLLACLDTHRPYMAGEESTHPVQDYLDPDQLACERAQIFRKLPIVAGFSAQVLHPGDFITHTYRRNRG